jgi:hypothetical protein
MPSCYQQITCPLHPRYGEALKHAFALMHFMVGVVFSYYLFCMIIATAAIAIVL